MASLVSGWRLPGTLSCKRRLPLIIVRSGLAGVPQNLGAVGGFKRRQCDALRLPTCSSQKAEITERTGLDSGQTLRSLKSIGKALVALAVENLHVELGEGQQCRTHHVAQADPETLYRLG